jgi:C4-dicarboxylate-specific signal transduction histidine kinase
MLTREELELKKLELEVKDLGWPVLRRVSTIVSMLIAIPAAIAFFFDARFANQEKEIALRETESAREEREKLDLEIAERRQELENVEEDLGEMTAIAKEKEENLVTLARQVTDATDLGKLKQATVKIREVASPAARPAADDYGKVVGDLRKQGALKPGVTASRPDLANFRRLLPVDQLSKQLAETRRKPPPGR